MNTNAFTTQDLSQIPPPIYKLLDTILNDELQKDLYKDGKWKLNESQTGFRQGMGCEVNILRLTEYIKEQFENNKHK